MPVLGHAFVGVAIGMLTRPAVATRPSRAWDDLWLPAVVLLAYLPDVVSQLGLLLGWSEGRLLGHSVLFAFALSPVIARMLTRLVKVPFARGLVTALVSLLVHDALDLAQATDRAPWWPLSDRRVAIELPLVPSGLVHEALAFGGVFSWRLVHLPLSRDAASRWMTRFEYQT